jgi:hypothetical protein
MDHSLTVMNELLAGQKIEAEFALAEDYASAAFIQPKQGAITLPSIEGLNGQVKAFVQKMEHAAQEIFLFTQQFYDHKDKMWDGFAMKTKELYGEDDELSEFAQTMARFMVFIRNLRHCIEHPKNGQRMVVKDFSLTPDGRLNKPTIEVVHSSTPQKRMELSSFLQQVSGEVLAEFEVLMVLLAAKHMKPFGGFEKAVGFLQEDQIVGDSKVRATYLIMMNGRWQKLGV